MHAKKKSRMRRARRARLKISELGGYRLCVSRTPHHIYAQIISADGSSTVASASTVSKKLRGEVGYGGNVVAAAQVGRDIAEAAKEKGIKNVSFDRSGFKYHGRIKALADAARENGLEF